jgi:hypothetical protein
MLPVTKMRCFKRWHYIELLSDITNQPFLKRIGANCTARGCEARVIYGEQKYKITVEPENEDETG